MVLNSPQLAARIKSLRLALDHSPQHMATLLDISTRAWLRYERGTHNIPKDVFLAICCLCAERLDASFWSFKNKKQKRKKSP
jgi:transcriptional regulator with XRE-family HTH domain